MTLLRKPVSIVIIGVYYLISPILNLIQIVGMTQLPLVGPLNVWMALNPFDWVVLGAFPLVGLGMLSVRRWGWIVFVSFSVFVIGYNFYAFLVNRVYDLGWVLTYNVVLAAVTFFFFRKHLRSPYFNPRMRWWNVDPRYPVVLSAQIGAPEAPCAAEVLDLSLSGAFLSTCEEISVGDERRISINAYGKTLVCMGKVMRKSAPDAAHPGFGVMFENVDPDAKIVLKWMVDKLVQEGTRERGLPPDAPLAKDPFVRHLAWHAKRFGRELIGA